MQTPGVAPGPLIVYCNPVELEHVYPFSYLTQSGVASGYGCCRKEAIQLAASESRTMTRDDYYHLIRGILLSRKVFPLDCGASLRRHTERNPAFLLPLHSRSFQGSTMTTQGSPIRPYRLKDALSFDGAALQPNYGRQRV